MSEPLTVQAALAAVIQELPAIGKTDKANELGYQFRGIETLTAAIQPLFGKHGVVIVPQVRSMEVVPAQASKHPAMQDVRLHVDWTIVGPNGSTLTASTFGIGRDHTDKGANKAQTQAFKYLLLHLLCISDAKDDTDGRDPEMEHGMGNASMAAGPTPIQVTWARVLSWAGTRNAEVLKAFAAENGVKLTEKAMAESPEWHAALNARLDALDAADAQDQDAEAPVAPAEPPAAPEATTTPEEPDTATELSLPMEPDEHEPAPPAPYCGRPGPNGTCYLPADHPGVHVYEEPF